MGSAPKLEASGPRSSDPPGSQPPGPKASPSERRRRDSITVSEMAEAYLRGMPRVASLRAGADNALRGALGLVAGDRFVLIVETTASEIGAALLDAATELGLDTRCYVVDTAQSRVPALAQRLELQLREAVGSVLVSTAGELDPDFRRSICVHDHARRHGHMAGVTSAMMRQSMRADYDEIHALGERLRARLQTAQTLDVVTGPRAALRVRLATDGRWHNGSGRLRSAGFTNLPGGEVVASPASVDGELLADGGIWLPDGTRLRAHRLRFRDGRLVEAEGLDGEALVALLDAHPNGRRVGQVAFGTNIGVLTPIGAVLQDLKMPGLHLVLGYSCPEHTGATWDSPLMVPVLCRRPDVSIDGEPILVRGRFTRSLL